MRTPEPSPGVCERRSMPQRNAASVFPEPVGAQISGLLPAAIDAQPPVWAGVGPSNDDSNQRRTRSENGSSACSALAFRSVANRPMIRRPIGDERIAADTRAADAAGL